jgi:hypothetical protein
VPRSRCRSRRPATARSTTVCTRSASSRTPAGTAAPAAGGPRSALRGVTTRPSAVHGDQRHPHGQRLRRGEAADVLDLQHQPARPVGAGRRPGSCGVAAAAGAAGHQREQGQDCGQRGASHPARMLCRGGHPVGPGRSMPVRYRRSPCVWSSPAARSTTSGG